MKDISLTFRSFAHLDSALLWVLAISVCLYFWWIFQRESQPARRWWVLSLRSLAALFVLFSFLQPVVQHKVRLSQMPVAIVVDRSQSMSVIDVDTVNKPGRWTAALETLRKMRPVLEKRFTPLYFALDEKLTRVSWDELEKSKSRGHSLNFTQLDGLSTASDQIRAVVIMSDGRASSGVESLPAVTHLGVPVYPVGVGNPTPDPDLILDNVRAPHFAFKNTDVEVAVRIKVRNFHREKVTLRITHSGQTVATTFCSSLNGFGFDFGDVVFSNTHHWPSDL